MISTDQTTENGAVVNGVSAEHQTTRKLGAAMPPPERKKKNHKKLLHNYINTSNSPRAIAAASIHYKFSLSLSLSVCLSVCQNKTASSPPAQSPFLPSSPCFDMCTRAQSGFALRLSGLVLTAVLAPALLSTLPSLLADYRYVCSSS